MSDNHASYAKIGFAVFVGVIATAVALVYIGGIGDSEEETVVETYYDKPVNGLSVGSPVNFRGVKVGQVREISFVGCKYPKLAKGRENGMIYIEMILTHAFMGERDSDAADVIRKMVAGGLRATVVSNGITGMSRIEIDYHPEDETGLSPKWTPRNVYLPAKLSLLDSFSDAATKAVNNFSRMDIDSVWSNVMHSVQSVAQLSDSVKVMMETRQEDVDGISASLRSASADLRDLAAELKGNPSLLVREASPEPLPETSR